MNIRTTALILTAALGTGGVWLWRTGSPSVEIPEKTEVVHSTPVPPPVAERLIVPEKTVEIKQAPQAVPVVRSAPPKPQMQLSAKNGKKATPTSSSNLARYWEMQEERFNRLLDQLAQTTDPRKRQALLNALAQHVRVDTLQTLDWIATLKSAEEQRIALEAVNKYALTGIGARIEVDSSGLPKIRETTILSAVESSGMVAAGDYISGMVKPDGTVLNFQDMPIQQIVQNLRGEPGSNIILNVQRQSQGGRIIFSVPVTRSMIVMQPFYN
ncbi:hypothetical protein [Pontiella agarivorans]|uniref:PDZ domain-containing protein n=1 Tax=Pontiella agarivorans TaxID=3038953 RepID=A0ABU5MYG2_9BACT|nr:hypothetical protein [Pontiella agarivorans]MDZ8119218.1 hypothetical protein [Pontiella agarivorans]